MRPLRYSINVTLDGCIDHRAGSADEHSHRHATETIARADSLILGRTMYELMEFWREPPADLPAWMMPFAETMNAAHKYLVSSTLEPDGWNAEPLRGDVVEAVRALKQQPGNGLYVGGLTLARTLADAGLIDEFEFVVQPHIAGHGPRLFEGLAVPLDLKLVDVATFDSGVRVERYVPAGSS
jgi:dihydrofolate reductase